MNIPAAMTALAHKQTPEAEWLRSKVGGRGYKDLVPTMALPIKKSG